MTTKATQGHTYLMDGPNGRKVMAMDSGEYPTVHFFDASRPWPLVYFGRVDASSLTPLPMTYFNGEVPQ